MSGPAQSAPVTGDAVIDAATRAVEDLSEHPVGDHHTELTRVHAALDAALHPEAVAAGRVHPATSAP